MVFGPNGTESPWESDPISVLPRVNVDTRSGSMKPTLANMHLLAQHAPAPTHGQNDEQRKTRMGVDAYMLTEQISSPSPHIILTKWCLTSI